MAEYVNKHAIYMAIDLRKSAHNTPGTPGKKGLGPALRLKTPLKTPNRTPAKVFANIASRVHVSTPTSERKLRDTLKRKRAVEEKQEQESRKR